MPGALLVASGIAMPMVYVTSRTGEYEEGRNSTGAIAATGKIPFEKLQVPERSPHGFFVMNSSQESFDRLWLHVDPQSQWQCGSRPMFDSQAHSTHIFLRRELLQYGSHDGIAMRACLDSDQGAD